VTLANPANAPPSGAYVRHQSELTLLYQRVQHYPVFESLMAEQGSWHCLQHYESLNSVVARINTRLGADQPSFPAQHLSAKHTAYSNIRRGLRRQFSPESKRYIQIA